MTIRASYERHPDLGCEAVVFIDDESMACFQIQRELVGGNGSQERHCVTTGASAPIYGAVLDWRRVDGNRLEFALTRRAGMLFGESELSFEITPVGDATVDEIVEHVERLLR
ncbi:MAG: hypothetical protein QM673_15850 [Gordonia sp. (in: high G+C Gram-positive bacteria)]